MNIYFIRHGKVKNPNNIWYGRLHGYCLSPQGIKKIEDATNFLSDKNIEQIYSSPLVRAKQSANILSDRLKVGPIRIAKDLLEVKSSLEGKSFEHVRLLKFNVFYSVENGVVGETIENLADRIKSFTNKILKENDNKNIAVVSHGDPIMTFKALIENLPLELSSIRSNSKWKYIEPGEVYSVKYKDNKFSTIKSVFKSVV